MGLFRARSRTAGLHPLVAEMDLLQVIADSPASLIITDSDGVIIHRNAAAMAEAAKVIGDKSESALQQMRDELQRGIRRATSFPYTWEFEVSGDGAHAWARATITKHGESYLCTWLEVTAEHDRRAVLAETAQELSGAAASFETLIAGLARDGDEVAARADAVASAAEELTASIRDISASASGAAVNTGTAVQVAGTVNQQIGSLSESSSQIGAVGQLINGIANQTNLLALNATIEAARAGEAGKGFAVVAGEVKDLAGRTSEATGSIAQMIDTIQRDSTDASGSITNIVQVIKQIEAEQTSIAGAVEEQSVTATEISMSVSAVAQVAQSSTQALGELKAAVSALAQKATRLHDLI